MPGNRSIFGDKSGGDRIQGILTKVGTRQFEVARARLAFLSQRKTSQVSQGDTAEFLARGEAATIKFLKGKGA
jgi:hypothetical protein